MAGKINAEAIKITESMWLSKNTEGTRLVAYYPVTDTIELLSTETGLTTSIGLHNESDTSHADIRSLIGTTVGTHNSDGTAHSAIQDKIGTDISSHNSDETAHTAIQEKIGTDIGAHDIAEDAHGDIRTALSTHTDDSTIHLGNADKIVVDADGNLSAGYGGWAGLETDGATTFVRFGTATQSYKFTVTDDGGQIQQLIDGDYTLVAIVPTSSDVGTTVSSAVSSHNSSGTAHSDIRTALSTHTNNTSNPHVVTLPQLTGGMFSYAYGRISDSGGGWWSGGDSSAYFDMLTANELTTENPIVNNTLTQKNTTTPTTYFNQVCNAGGLPEIFRKSPTDSTPVNIGTPYFTGTHWGVCDNTPLAKLTVTPPANTSFASMDYINPTGAIRADEISFASSAVSRAVFPSALVSGAIYRISAGVRFYQAAGGTAGTHTLNLYLNPDTIPFGQWTRYVGTGASDAWQLIDLTFKVVDLSSTQFALVINANGGGRPDYHAIAKTAVPELFLSLGAASGNTYGTHITVRTSHLEVYRIK